MLPNVRNCRLLEAATASTDPQLQMPNRSEAKQEGQTLEAKPVVLVELLAGVQLSAAMPVALPVVLSARMPAELPAVLDDVQAVVVIAVLAAVLPSERPHAALLYEGQSPLAPPETQP